MDTDNTIPPGLRNPADLFFQKDGVRRAIVAAYWTVIILAIPLWWHTTSIERLPLPDARVSHQVSKSISIPVQVCIEGASEGLVSQVEGAGGGGYWGSMRWCVVLVSPALASKDAYVVTTTGPERVLRSRQLTYPVDESHHLQSTNFEGKDKQNRVVQFSSRYRLAFSLLNEDASAGNAVMAWNVQKGIQEHIQPVLDILKPLHNFTIESQVQYYAPLAFGVQPTEDRIYGLSYEDLTVFVNSAEWTLSSSASNDPVLHFLLFIPSASHTPLKILTSKSDAFLLPQWGGISIYNTPHLASFAHLSDRTLHRTFTTFSTQLLTLLGIPELPAGIASQDIIADLPVAAGRADEKEGVGDCQGDTGYLANSIENMPVHADVRDDIEGSLDALEKMYSTTSTSLSQAFTYSAEAFNLASRAFFNPGMLALLYFPCGA
ncbi:hypothetical protein FA13DRAFT_1753791 [Coprinellus micaceus]|uniref:GPI transamidase component PIG-S n=1 Tax=Coprinellus micaceus TaxID=71717 RepID=A0A4Y7TJK7_COPMI|nr:hypothetical protein FA13DRAFT_1753791 [Coprinellus micaceus]